MTLPAIAYLLTYISLAALSAFWIRCFWKVRSTSLIFDSWLGSWTGLLLIGLGYLLGTLVSSDQRIQLVFGFCTFLAASFFARRTIGRSTLWSSLPAGQSGFLPAVRFFILFFGLDQLLKQFDRPPFGWDELAVWIPKMQVIAAGQFSEIHNLAIPSYPPLWPVIGSFALRLDSMMLYLLPVFLLIHVVLVMAEYAARRGGRLALIALLLLLPSVFGVAEAIQGFTLYSNFPVAVLVLGPYLLDRESEKTRGFFWGLFLGSAVLMRTDTIIPVALLAFLDWKTRGRPIWFVWPAIGYASWVVFRKIHDIPDEIAVFAMQGVREIFHQDFPVARKILGIFLFALKRVWWNQTYWFLPVFILLTMVQRLRNKWVLWTGVVWMYVFFQYLVVPLGLGADINWWLGTGWIRMMSLPVLIVFVELALMVGAGAKKMVSLIGDPHEAA